jgi:hypothetical protein
MRKLCGQNILLVEGKAITVQLYAPAAFTLPENIPGIHDC